MSKKLTYLALAIGVLLTFSCNCEAQKSSGPLDVYKAGSFGAAAIGANDKFNPKMGTFPGEENMNYATDIVTGAQRVGEYPPLLKGKKVCVLSNQSGMVNETSHVLDTLVASGVNVTCIMSPEHGFRGDADAGEHVGNSVDSKTGIPIRSLYGAKNGSSKELLKDVDVMVFDLQDVGVRFYTYYVTMVEVMAACAIENVEFIVLDRPNPIGYLVDGPILDMKYKSGVGGLPIPIAHGMTLGEIANMTNGEGWLVYGNKAAKGLKCNLKVITCENYDHSKLYKLPIKPSPNLPDMRAIYLYPSTCYFEATPVSLGRGTDKAFEMYGHPNMKGYNFSFIPRGIAGAKTPPQHNKECFGVDLRTQPAIDDVIANGVNLEYVIDAYNNLNLDDHFFRSFFELEVGQAYIRKMIKQGKSAAEIKAVWTKDVEQFKKDRAPYLLYK